MAPSGLCPTPTPSADVAANSLTATSSPTNSTVSAADSPQTFISIGDAESGNLGLYIGIGVGLFLLLLLVIVTIALVIRRRRGRDENEDVGGLSEIIDGRGHEYGSMSGVAAISALGSQTLPGRTLEYASVASMRGYDALSTSPITYASVDAVSASPITYASVKITGEAVYDAAFPIQPQE